MSDKLSLYDYLGFILPGSVVVAVIIYGFDLARPTSDPSAQGVILLTAAAFLIGHLIVAVGNALAPIAFGRPPFARLSSTEGLFGRGSRYSEADRKKIEVEFASYFPNTSTFQQQFDIGYTLLRQKKLDTALQTANQQIGLYRNMIASTFVCLPLLAVAAGSGHKTLRPEIWIPLTLVSLIVFMRRLRRFWIHFGDEVLRGVRALRSTLNTESTDNDAHR